MKSSLLINRTPSSLRKSSINENIRCDAKIITRGYNATNVLLNFFHKLSGLIQNKNNNTKKSIRCSKRLVRPLSVMASLVIIFYFLSSLNFKSVQVYGKYKEEEEKQLI